MRFVRSRICALVIILTVAFAALRVDADQLEGKHVYVLSKPMQQTTRLSKPWQIGHYIFEGVQLVGEVGLMWFTTYEPISTSINLLRKSVLLPAYVRVQSWTQLKAMAVRKNGKELKKVAQLPEIGGFDTLSGQSTMYNGFVAAEQTSNQLVFVVSDKPLDTTKTIAEQLEAVGKPLPKDETFQSADAKWIEIENPAETRIQFRLRLAGMDDPEIPTWSPSIEELKAGVIVPENIKEDWVKRIDERTGSFTAMERYITRSRENELTIEVELLHPPGTNLKNMDLGAFVQGKSVRDMIARGAIRGKIERHVLERIRGESPKMVSTSFLPVIDEAEQSDSCMARYRRLMGKEFTKDQMPKPVDSTPRGYLQPGFHDL